MVQEFEIGAIVRLNKELAYVKEWSEELGMVLEYAVTKIQFGLIAF